MRVLIIGGNGQTGRLVIDEALQRGHKVTALIRKPSTLPAEEGRNIIKGTPGGDGVWVLTGRAA